MLHLPPKSMGMVDAVGRAVSSLLSLRNFNVSLRLGAEASENAVESAVRQAVEKSKLLLPEVRGQVADITRGLQLMKKAQTEADKADEEQEETMVDIRQGKQGVLAPLFQAPGAKVIGGSSKKRKEAPTTRAGDQGDKVDQAEAARQERLSAEKAEKHAKKQRLEDIKAATAKPKPTRKIAGGLPKPRHDGVPGADSSRSSSSSALPEPE